MGQHHALVDRKLEGVARGEIKRLIVEEPPRHGKTMHCGLYFPPWYFGINPTHNFMYVSGTDDIADAKSLACRNIVDEYGPSHLGIALHKTQRSKSRWKLEGSGVDEGEFIAAGIGSGRLMGSGANVLLIDDQFRNVEDALSAGKREKDQQWYLSTSKTRLLPNAAIIMICTRWHHDDLIGFVQRQAESTGEQWEVVSLPAVSVSDDDPLGRSHGEPLWPEQYGKDALEEIRLGYVKSGYSWMWDALYQQQPPRVIDSEWPSEYFDEHIWYDTDDEFPGDSVCTTMALDPSLGRTEHSDYSAVVTAKRDKHGVFWIDSDIRRRPTTDIVQDTLRIHRQYRPHGLGIEANGFQELIKPELERQAGSEADFMSLFLMQNSAEKLTRIRTLTPFLAQQRIRLRRNSPGCNLLYEQLMNFPSHKYDDGPDALEMALRLNSSMMSEEVMRL